MTTGDAHADIIEIGGLRIRFVLEGTESDGNLAIFEIFVPPGASVPAPHSHDGYEETLYGIEGTLTWTVEGVAIEVGPGEAVYIPRGAVHRFDNFSDADARAVAVVTPGILGPAFFREMGAVVAEAAGGPPDVARIGEIMRRHGLTPAPPPTR